MKIHRLSLVLTLTHLVLGTAVAAPKPQKDSFVDVIIHADGVTGDLSQKVKSLGGEVHFHYRNVPAIAAKVPAAAVVELANSAGVSKIEKDRIIYLDDLN